VAILFIIIGIPVIVHFEEIKSRVSTDSLDAISSASVVIPSKPTGEFYILINTDKHSDSVEDWEKFFTSDDVVVIFDDINCLVANTDANGLKVATMYQAILPENQMKLRTENPVLLASKAENGYIDFAIFSAEMATALELKVDLLPENIKAIKITRNED